MAAASLISRIDGIPDGSLLEATSVKGKMRAFWPNSKEIVNFKEFGIMIAIRRVG